MLEGKVVLYAKSLVAQLVGTSWFFQGKFKKKKKKIKKKKKPLSVSKTSRI